jgi:signal peptide peptidase SppA
VTLASRILNTPLLIRPEKLHAILAGLGPRLLPDAPPHPGAEATLFRDEGPNARRELEIVDGVAVIDVAGTLTQRTMRLGWTSGLTSYAEIEKELAAALAAPAASAILLRIDSPGGEASGVAVLADLIAAASARKPVIAWTDGMAASAAYWLMSAADRVLITRDAVLGSIGATMAHYDISGAEASAGIRVTEIYAGAGKTDLSPHRPIDEAARGRLQGFIDGIYAMFRGSVATWRGLTEAQIETIGARVLMGADAIAAGLADAIALYPEALAAARAAGRSHPMPKTRANAEAIDAAATDRQEPTPPAPEVAAAAQIPAPVADTAEAVRVAFPAAAADLLTAGATTERARVAAIDAHTIPGLEPIAARAKAEGLAVDDFLRLQTAEARAAALTRSEALRIASTAAAVPPAPPTPTDLPELPGEASAEARAEALWARDPAIRQDFEALGERAKPAFLAWFQRHTLNN